MFPYEYINEILDIARANNTQWDIALLMFLNNIEDSHLERGTAPGQDQYFYHGADQLDYKALRSNVDLSDASWKSDITNEYNAVYRANIQEIIRLNQAGDRAGLKAFMIEAAKKFRAQ